MWKCGVLGIAVVITLTGSAFAQDVKWRHDYAMARKEATATGKPLLLDFGTEACTWCKKLDATTFRNPAIVALLNERFIPVKIDAEREEKLTEAVKVDSFPTLLLVSSDGKIVARHVGYADVAQMHTFLAKAPGAKPQTESAAADLLTRARNDHDAGDYLTCLERCEQIGATFPNTPEATTARELAKRIATDPAKWQRVTSQVESELAALRKSLNK
jgi:thioredoxin-like negative regulator of GroEL